MDECEVERRARAAGFEKRLEQHLLLPFLDEILRVPLHAGEKGALPPFERLDEVVRRSGQREEGRGQVFHALVVARVHGEAVEGGDRRGESRAGSAGPRADRVSDRRTRVRIVREGARALGLEILPEGAPERDVDDLKSAADTEDRDLESLRGTKEREVQGVPFGINLETGSVRDFAVARGVHIAAAREKQAVERAGVRVAGEHDDDLFRQGACREQGAAVDLVRLVRVGRDDDLHGWKCAFRTDGAAPGARGVIIETTWESRLAWS